VQHAKANNWWNRFFDYSGDEPPEGISWTQLKQNIQQIQAVAPGITTLVTTNIQLATEQNVLTEITRMVPIVNHLDGSQWQNYPGDQRPKYDLWLGGSAHNSLWTYQSCMSQGCGCGCAPENSASEGWPTYLIDAPAARNRGMQWVDFIENVSGELYWDTTFMLPSAWTNQWGFHGNGDGNLWYPGLPSLIGGTSHIPIAGIRIKMIRQGMQDFEWLSLLAKKDYAFARSVATSLIPDAYKVPNNGYMFDEARGKIISRFLQLAQA